MQKTHMKLGLLIAIACLFLVAGNSALASAHTVQSTKRFHHWFLQAPHITVKLLSPAGRHSKNGYTGRALIYGVGFHAANGYGPCDSCGNTTSTSTTCISTDCGSSITTTTTSSTTTTSTSTTTTSPSNQSGTSTTCPSDCGSSTPVSTSTTCSSYSSCSGSAPAGPSNQPGPSTTCPSDCSGNAPAGPSSQPGTTCSSYSSCGNSTPVGPSTTCSSYSSCGSSAPAGPSNQPGPSTTCPSDCSGNAPAGPSYNDCGCSNTVDLQSSTPISAYTPGINLDRVPVNAFGEFRVIVNVRPPVRHHYHYTRYTVPTIWAVNTYNDQPSNDVPMCYCGG